jgi:hypothetical protein
LNNLCRSGPPFRPGWTGWAGLPSTLGWWRGSAPPVDDSEAISLVPEKKYGYLVFLCLVFKEYPKRAILGASLMITQSFLYNAMAISAWLSGAGVLNATTQTFVWVVIFFFASAGASSAYLTVSETWPIEIRSEAIAVFFAIAQIFGALGPRSSAH